MSHPVAHDFALENCHRRPRHGGRRYGNVAAAQRRPPRATCRAGARTCRGRGARPCTSARRGPCRRPVARGRGGDGHFARDRCRGRTDRRQRRGGASRWSRRRCSTASTSSPPTRPCWPITAPRSRDSPRTSGVALGFEAAVAGGIPILKALREGLGANNILRVYGILNGTCNYILTQMRELGRDFAAVLAEAQSLGYAEADPSFDIDGIDTAHKLALLAAVAFAQRGRFRRRPRRGHPPRHRARHRLRRRPRLPHQALGRGAAHRSRARAARSSLHGAADGPDRACRRRVQRGDGRRRLRRTRHARRSRRRRRADRLGGGRRSHRHRHGPRRARLRRAGLARCSGDRAPRWRGIAAPTMCG